MFTIQITLPEFADINDRMEVSAREIVGPVLVTTGDCPGLGRIVAVQADQGVTLMSEIQFKPPGYSTQSAMWRNPGSPLASAYAWN